MPLIEKHSALKAKMVFRLVQRDELHFYLHKIKPTNLRNPLLILGVVTGAKNQTSVKSLAPKNTLET